MRDGALTAARTSAFHELKGHPHEEQRLDG
ncbi:hypothetical protein [Thermomonospora echinospora]